MTLGTSSLPAYTLLPGLLILLRPLITGLLSVVYLRVTRNMPCFLSLIILYDFIKPSSFKIFANSTFILEAGMSTFSVLIRRTFLILVSISAIGSVIIIAPLPARFCNPGDEPPEGKCPEADSAKSELSQIASRSPAYLAPVIGTYLKLGRFVAFFN